MTTDYTRGFEEGRRAGIEAAAKYVDGWAEAAAYRARIDGTEREEYTSVAVGIRSLATPAPVAPCGEWFAPFGLPAESFIKRAKCSLPAGHLGHHKWTASFTPSGPPTTLDAPAPVAPPLVHFAMEPFRPICGADVPNQMTTTDYEHATCPKCRAPSEKPTCATCNGKGLIRWSSSTARSETYGPCPACTNPNEQP
jgi:hypothetical protein